MAEESRTLEFKENINSKTFLKTVSAFANYEGGTIIFGINDDGKVIGLSDPREDCLRIENAINDNISPKPEYSLSVQADHTILLQVESGLHKPYFYKSKAYKRNDTATVEVDTEELKHIIMESKNISFEEIVSQEQDLTFQKLTDRFQSTLGLHTVNDDTLKTLNLLANEKGYTNAGAIFADHNQFPGIDIARFGETISIILKRATLEHMSILSLYDQALQYFKDTYEYEEIKGFERIKVEKIPEEAFREAVANALIHRDWSVNANIRIAMFEDRLEIVSPESLPKGVTKEDYLRGNLSILRNPNIADIFFRLHLVEKFGTGIIRIKESYQDSMSKPAFEITSATVKITLPLLTKDLGLQEDEQAVYNLLSRTTGKSISDILKETPFSRTKVKTIIGKLIDKNLVSIEGKQRGTKYLLK